jgi:hypothetical protein
LYTKSQQRFIATLESLEVSQEGLVGDVITWISSLFSYTPPDHKKLVGKAFNKEQSEIKNVSKLRKALKSCFSDRRWLSHQEFVESDIDATLFASKLVYGAGDFTNPFESVQLGADRTVNSLLEIFQASRREAEQIKACYERALADLRPITRLGVEVQQENINNYKDGSERSKASFLQTVVGDIIPSVVVNRRVTRLVDELQWIKEKHTSASAFWDRKPNYELFEAKSETGGFGSRKVSSLATKLPTTLPALNSEQILTLSNLLISWIDSGYLYAPKGVLGAALEGDAKYGWSWGLANQTAWDPENDDDPDEEEMFWYFVEYSTRQEYVLKDLLDRKKFMDRWINDSALFTTLTHPAVGIVHWMGASIKGRLASI